MKRRRRYAADWDGWDNTTVRLPAALRQEIRERMRAAGFRTFGEYLRHLIRVDLRPPVS